MKRLIAFVEDRTGLVSAVKSLTVEKRLPAGVSFLQTLGFAALFLFALQVVTGIALALHYSPATASAYDSIRAFEQDVPLGRFVRGLHHFGASFMVVAAVVHALRVFASGAYKRPRELTWLLGLGLLGCTLGLGFTGYLLPWDQKAYFATRVGVEVAAHAPFGGAELKQALLGGPDIGPNTLPRFFALHALLLPAALALLLAFHLQQVNRHGITPPGARVGEPGRPGPAYFPAHFLKEGCVVLVVAAALAWLAQSRGAPLEAQADPADPAYDPRPDWYFLPLFQLLKLFEGPLEPLGAFYLPAGFGLLLALLPFLDRNPERRLARRPLCAAGLGLFVTGTLALGVLGALDRPKHYRTPPHPLHAAPEIRRGYDLVRREGCFGCHTYTNPAGEVFGRAKEDAPDFADLEDEAAEIAEYLVAPDSDVMPAFDHLPRADRLAIGRYLERLR